MDLDQISALLFESDSDAECVQAAINLHALLSGIVELNDDPTSTDLLETQLNEGKALSPRDAARCILDYMRTRSFLRGVRRAVIDAQVRFPDETIHVVYAGCGPFAPLFIPLTTQFGPDQVQFTLMDIHERSLAVARQIVEELGLSTYVRDFVQCDASTHKISDEPAPHIILIETMQRALEREPQVAITRNLIRNLRDGGILIPEKIELRAFLGDASKEVVADDSLDSNCRNERRKRIDLGTAFELNASSARQRWTRCEDATSASSLCSLPVKITMPQITNGAVDLMILTEITVYDSIVLRDYESALTYPTVLVDLSRLDGSQLEFQYICGETPGLSWKEVLECGDSSPLSECRNESL